MGWFKRDGKLFYRWSRRTFGRVETDIYPDDLGYGPGSGIARHVARVLRRDKRKRERERERVRAIEAKFFAPMDEAVAIVGRWHRTIGLAIEDALESAGYHRQNRGPWRRKRRDRRKRTVSTKSATSLPAPNQPPQPTETELRALAKQADTGDREALSKLMSLIGNDLQRLITLSSAGDMARMAEYFVINRQTSEHNHATRQARYQKFTQLRGQLSGPHPSPLEKLVVERIVFTWFHVNTLEVILGKHEDLTPERVDQIERRRERSPASASRRDQIAGGTAPSPTSGAACDADQCGRPADQPEQRNAGAGAAGDGRHRRRDPAHTRTTCRRGPGPCRRRRTTPGSDTDWSITDAIEIREPPGPRREV